MTTTRRTFLTAAGSSALLASCAGTSTGAEHAKPGEFAEDVTPAEDLMREHGVLRRVMCLYDEAAMRLDTTRDVPLDALVGCAGIVRRVIEDYHEKLEENFLFPRFERVGKFPELTATLRHQHQVGRTLTDQIVVLATASLADPDRAKLATLVRRFNHMYRPHAAREDIVLFPELRSLVGAKECQGLGEQFEDKEKQMLGDNGFEHAVADVANMEKLFGVDDLAKLTV